MNLKNIILPVSIIGLLGFTSYLLAEKKPTNNNMQANTTDADMQKVLDAMASFNGKPITQLTPEQARLQASPADAVLKVLKDEGKSTAPQQVASVKEITILGPYGDLPAHVFTPYGAGPFPVIVYFHGGGFVIASTKVYEASVRGLANGAEAIVVSVDYHLAPEHKYPTQAEEAYAAYAWVLKHAAELNGDAKRVAVAGESAGGNLAAVVSLMARDKQAPMPVHQLLVYPVVDNQMRNASYIQHVNAKPLNRPMMEWFFKHYVRNNNDAEHAYALPNKAKSLTGLPSTTIITAEIDPLYTEGKAFAERLKSDSVPVAYQHYAGVTHEFFGMAAVVSKAKDAQAFASAELKKAFAAVK